MSVHPHKRQLSLSDQCFQGYVAAAQLHALRHHEACEYQHCARFWEEVFERVYLTKPSSDRDVRWDPLFRVGFPTLRKLLRRAVSSH